MTNRKKEIAKFFCGVEAFHAVMHGYFWQSGKTINAFGVKENPDWHKAGAVGHAVIAVALGVYAWGLNSDSTRALAESETAGNDG